MHVTSAESTELSPDTAEPLQLVRVHYLFGAHPAPVRVEGRASRRRAPARPCRRGEMVEVPVRVSDPVVGERRRARAGRRTSAVEFDFIVAEPGWTMYMVSHFHYDPVVVEHPGRLHQRVDRASRRAAAGRPTGFELVNAHLEMARREPEYKFVLAEVDYLKPYWDTNPEDRDDLRQAASPTGASR